MNVRRISWGLIILFVGLILLFSNLGYIDFNWTAVFALWPVLLIIFGVSFILPDKPESKYIMTLITIGILVLFAYQGLTSKRHFWNFEIEDDREINQNYFEDDRTNDNRRIDKQEFRTNLSSDTKFATLNIEGGVVDYRIGKSTTDLFSASASSNLGGFSLLTKEIGGDSVLGDEKVVLDFKMNRNKTVKLKKSEVDNRADMKLSAVPIWSINLEIGAGSADFDLSDYKIKKFKIEGGVSSIHAKMGMPIDYNTEINFEGGLASFDLAIPEGAACRVVSESALSSKELTGFKQKDGSYVTENYHSSQRRYEVKMETGLSSLVVERY